MLTACVSTRASACTSVSPFAMVFLLPFGLLPLPLVLQCLPDGCVDLRLRAVPLVLQRLLGGLFRRRLVLGLLERLGLPGAHVRPGRGLALHGREVRQLDPAIAVPVGDVFRLCFVERLKFAGACFGLLLFVRQRGRFILGGGQRPARLFLFFRPRGLDGLGAPGAALQEFIGGGEPGVGAEVRQIDARPVRRQA